MTLFFAAFCAFLSGGLMTQTMGLVLERRAVRRVVKARLARG